MNNNLDKLNNFNIKLYMLNNFKIYWLDNLNL